jgi:hypothetical protein
MTISNFSPTAISNSNAYGTIAWTNVANAGSSDDVYSTLTLGAGTVSNWLKATFTCNIPTGATINSYTFQVERKVTSGAANDDLVRLVVGNAVVGTNPAVASAIPGTDTVKSYVTSTGQNFLNHALGGSFPTVAQINAGDFGVVYAVNNGAKANADVSVDTITLVIDYTPLGSLVPGKAIMMNS